MQIAFVFCLTPLNKRIIASV